MSVDTAQAGAPVHRSGRPVRVLHCPWNVAGQSAQLAASERALGADSRCVVVNESAKGFPADEVLAGSDASIPVREAARWRLLWRAIRWADVVHFAFGQTCLVPHAFPGLDAIRWKNPLDIAWRLYCRSVWLKDLPLLSSLGKTLAVTWQGDDARQHDRSLELFDISIAKALGDTYYIPGSDYWKRRAIDKFARHVPIHYALNPDLLHVLPSQARFLPYASFDPFSVLPQPPSPTLDKPLVFAHAPSHRGAKGTEHVLEAAEALRNEGLQFELRLIEGLPRNAALQAYAQCDVVIDQLLAGWYGGLGVEVMSMAKPLVVYLRDGDVSLLPLELVESLPMTSATPSTIAHVMRSFIFMPRAQLHATGWAMRSFVEQWHDPRRIAERTLVDYATHAPRQSRGG